MMTTFSLLWKELLHRKGNTLLGTAVVTCVVALIVGSMLLSDGYRQKTEQHVAQLDDEIRKTMKQLGFNIFIFPRDLNLGDFFESDFGQVTMGEELVHKLADAKNVMTINHLRPALIQKVDWPEQNRQIRMMGVQGVVPWSHRKNPKKPLAEPVPPGTIHLGSQLAQRVGAKPDAEVQLQGRSFKVGKIYPPRGNKDDMMAWVDLATVQELTNLPGRINMIQALNCNCASVDALAEIEAEISGVLGSEVKVVEQHSQLITRARARTKVGESGKQNVALVQQATVVGVAVLTLLGSLILALMFLRNASERTGEVGMLRAIGVGRNQILTLFLAKAALIGLTGGVLGLAIGALAAGGIAANMDSFATPAWPAWLIAAAPAAAAVLSVLATWIPVEAVTGKDPASILRQAS